MLIDDAYYSSDGRTALRILTTEGEALFQDIPVSSPDLVKLKFPIPASLSGTITNTDGSPAKGLWLTLDSEYKMVSNDGKSSVGSGISGVYGTKTDAQGYYEIPQITPDMPYYITVRAPISKGAYTLSPKNLLDVIRPGEDKEWDYTIKESVKISGILRGEPSGNPLADIEVKASNLAFGKTKTDINGYYEFMGAFTPGTCEIAPYYKEQQSTLGTDFYAQSVDLDYGDDLEFDLTLPDPATVQFRVVDHNNNPLGNIRVSPLKREERSTHQLSPIGYTNTEGIFSWSNMLPGVKLSFRFNGEAPAESQEYIADPGTIFPEETIVIYPKTSIEGYALNADGTPIVARSFRGQAFFDDIHTHHFITSITGENGYFTLENNLPATTVELLFKTSIVKNDGQYKWSTWKSPPIQLTPDTITNLGEIQFFAPEE